MARTILNECSYSGFTIKEGYVDRVDIKTAYEFRGESILVFEDGSIKHRINLSDLNLPNALINNLVKLNSEFNKIYQVAGFDMSLLELSKVDLSVNEQNFSLGNSFSFYGFTNTKFYPNTSRDYVEINYTKDLDFRINVIMYAFALVGLVLAYLIANAILGYVLAQSAITGVTFVVSALLAFFSRDD